MMIPIANNEDAAAAKYAIECAMHPATTGPDAAVWQLWAGESLLTTIDPQHCELSVEWGKLIFAWWDEAQSQSWRVTAYALDKAELRLQVTRGLAREITTLTLRNETKWRARVAAENLTMTERRQAYAQMLARLLAKRGDTVPSQNLAAEEKHSETSGTRKAPAKRYARFRLKVGREIALAIGVSEAESQADIDGVIAAGLVWLTAFNQQGNQRQEATEQRKNKTGRQAKRLWFCLPPGHLQTAIERLALLDTSHLDASIACFELDERHEALRPVQLATQDELLNRHPRELKWPEAAPANDRWRERILRLAPEVIEIRQITGQAKAAQSESYAINGLEFARSNLNGEARTAFGVAGLRDEKEAERVSSLSEANFHRLERLVQEIVQHRSAQTTDRRHPFYRLREEAWLESLLRRDIRALDAGFDDRFVYSQIPAWRGEERSVIDLLTVNQTGQAGHEARLAVIEIKASEDAQLPLQGLDYWLRVEQARLRGEFARRGLFAGIELANQSPLLYLVAPRLRFHRTFAIVARCLSPQIEAYQIGLNANWREGVRVRSIERVNSTGLADLAK